MSTATTLTIPAGHGKAFVIKRQELVTVSMVDGAQVADTWAFCLQDMAEFVSTEHTRSCLDKLSPRPGEAFYSNRRRPLLTIVADSSPGVHDLLLSACDPERYTLLGFKGYHRNCVDNLYQAMAEMELIPPELPSPLNLFEKVAINAAGDLEIMPPPGQAGQGITLRAEEDLILVISACPMDIVPTNGADCQPKPVAVLIQDGPLLS